jgi:soluble lytic murein transglycosylase
MMASSLKRAPIGLATRVVALAMCVLLTVTPVLAQDGNAPRSRDGGASGGGRRSAKKAGKSIATPRSRKPSSHAQVSRAARQARTVAIRQAFTASSELRPMAEQLAALRTPEIYAAVTAYAHNHSGEAAATAYLALGHAYLLDKKYSDAGNALRESRKLGGELADYADFLGAQAAHEGGNNAQAEELLHGFLDRHPDSIFDVQAPELEASVLLAQGDPNAAQKALDQGKGLAAEDRPGYQFEQGEVDLALGSRGQAERIFHQLMLSRPTSQEAQLAKSRLLEIAGESAITVADRRTLADAYYNGGRYGDAAEQYRQLAHASGVDASQRDHFAVAAAACDWKLKRLTKAQAEALADTDDEAGARRSYLLMELARDHDSASEQQRIVNQMEQRFPHSQWLAEALYSSGNMYLLKKDYATAAGYYSTYATRFPQSKNASLAHWRAGWLNYRMGQFDQATRYFDEQIRLFPQATETIGALYWRGRLLETREHNPQQAVSNYRAIIRVAPHFFYAQMAQKRLAALGNTQAASEGSLSHFQPLPEPKLIEKFPDASPHLAKARLLANAGLNEYVAREISADPDFGSASALAEAQIFSSYGETFRALKAAKRAISYSASAPIPAIPMVYWRILFPEPWWQTIKAESAKNNLDPYLVASLIRQESEFDNTAVSYANAWGLMQLLPTTGKRMAAAEGLKNFQTSQLMDPALNIKLGTRYLRMLMDKFGGQSEYALAAYNAGDTRVDDWRANGPYSGMDEFVESIPFTQTREYVQAILRNVEIYHSLDAYERTHER